MRVLFDLSDAVADAVQLPLDRISPEMVWRGLYHFNNAYNKGTATDPIAYLSAPEKPRFECHQAPAQTPENPRPQPFFQ